MLVFGLNPFPASDLAIDCHSSNVTIKYFDGSSSIEQADGLLHTWTFECATAVLMVCNCPCNLTIPFRLEVNVADTNMMPSVRTFVCAQSNECLPGQAGLPAQCELLLCDAQSKKLTLDATRHLNAIFLDAIRLYFMPSLPGLLGE